MDSAVDVIYVQPELCETERCIDFAQFAEYVRRFADPLSQTFANHLDMWRSAAGARQPP
jgi:hypothetical protein